MCGDPPRIAGGRIKRQPSTGRRMAARKAGAQNRRASVSIRSEAHPRKEGPNVESIFNVMKAYMSLELELADENQVM